MQLSDIEQTGTKLYTRSTSDSCSENMAAGGRIVALLIVLCALLPLLAYAAHPSIDDGFNSLSIPTDKVDSLDSLENEDEDNDDVSKDNKERHIKSVMRAQNLENKKDKKKKEPKPVKKVGPEEPVKPAKPVQPVNPAKPAQPVNPAKPVQPVNPVNTVGPAPGVLREGFYQQTCPQAEKIIQDTMDKIFEKNVKVAPALVRLFFHDCFVTGCDASILLEKTPSGEKTEREAPQNGAFVRGFEEIEEIKAALEAACPGVVSCADTLAFAARESLVQNGLPRYPVAAGRRDRPVSLSANAERDLPFPDTPAQEMVQMFERKGMTIDDLVVLIGAHSIGEAHCTVYEGRFRDPEKRKDINPQYLDQLHVQSFCVDQDQTLPFDRMSQNIMDAGFYKQLLAHETLIESDHNLAVAPNTNAIMKRYADDQVGWTTRFIQAINKLGGLEVLTGDQGEIRKQCRAFN